MRSQTPSRSRSTLSKPRRLARRDPAPAAQSQRRRTSSGCRRSRNRPAGRPWQDHGADTRALSAEFPRCWCREKRRLAGAPIGRRSARLHRQIRPVCSANCASRLFRQSKRRSCFGSGSSSIPLTSPVQVSICARSNVQGASPPRCARRASSIASRPRPTQLVAVYSFSSSSVIERSVSQSRVAAGGHFSLGRAINMMFAKGVPALIGLASHRNPPAASTSCHSRAERQ